MSRLAPLLLCALSASAEAKDDSNAPSFRGALELSALAFPSGVPPGGEDGFVQAVPLLSYEAREGFALELGAVLRGRVIDTAPDQRAADHFGFLRREDWDQLSDFGQLLRALRFGTDGAAFQLEAGALHQYTLGTGQLISRYSNALNPNYHPAGASAAVFTGPVRTELFASDVLGGRLFALEVAADMARTFGASADAHDRYRLSFAVAHDFGRAGGTAPPLSLAWLELDATLHRSSKAQFAAYLGAGGRAQDDGESLGATLGAAGDVQLRGARLGGRLEARKQNSGFRQGMVGFDYELARFSGLGFSEAPIAQERLPNTFSFKAELAADLGGGDGGALEKDQLIASVAAEHFTHGRTDVDVAVKGRAFNGRGALAARFAVVGLGRSPRYVASLEARYRFAPSLYALATSGNVYFPQPNGTLQRGVFAGLGLGADFAK